jgi:hypothetical protein
LNLRPLGYEPYDARLWRLGQALADAVTSADGAKHVPLAPSRLSPPTLFAASGLQIGLQARLRHEWIALRFRASTAVAPAQAWSRRRPQRAPENRS